MGAHSSDQSSETSDPTVAEGPSTWIAAVADEQCKAAFAKLFTAFAPRIKAQLMRQGLGPTLAEEVAQETLLAIWRRAGQFDPGLASAEAWIYAVARNQRIDALRRELRHRRPMPEDAAPPPSTPEQHLNADEDVRHVRTALANLAESHAELMRRSYYEEHSHSRIASDLHIPLGTVKSRLRQATRHLRLMLPGGI